MPHHLSEIDRARIVAFLENGWAIRQVAQLFQVSKNTVLRIKKKWFEEGILGRKVGSGGHIVSTEENDEALINFLREHPFETAVTAKRETNFPGSQRTALRRLKYSDLNNYSAASKFFLTEIHRQRRLAFAHQYSNMNEQFWSNVIFSDEKVFQSYHNGRVRVYRPQNSRYSQRYIKEIKKSGRFSVNMWAWISVHGPGVCWLINERFTGGVYRTVLENIMLPSVTQLFPENFIFQHDNCPVHTSRIVLQCLEDNGIQTLPWPANSPDLNPIENVWAIIVKKLYQVNVRIQNAEQLTEQIQNIWEEIDPEYTRNLINSMPRRLQCVIDANGGATKY